MKQFDVCANTANEATNENNRYLICLIIQGGENLIKQYGDFAVANKGFGTFFVGPPCILYFVLTMNCL